MSNAAAESMATKHNYTVNIIGDTQNIKEFIDLDVREYCEIDDIGFFFTDGGLDGPGFCLTKLMSKNPNLIFLIKAHGENCYWPGYWWVRWTIEKLDHKIIIEDISIEDYKREGWKINSNLLKEYEMKWPGRSEEHFLNYEEFKWKRFFKNCGMQKCNEIINNHEQYKEMVEFLDNMDDL